MRKLWLSFWLFTVSLVPWVQAAPVGVTLSGETSRPHDSTFCLGEKPVVKWSVQGLAPGQNEMLAVSIKDEHLVEIERRSVPVVADANGSWAGQMELPGSKQGFFRVFATLGSGVSLPAIFTRPGGFLTYAVVPDVKLRQDYGQAESRFGLQGSPGPNSAQVLPRMGVRWILNGKAWSTKEPKFAGEFKARTPEAIREEKAKAKDSGWNFYRLHCIDGAPAWAGKPETRVGNHRTAELTPEGEKAYAAYCREVALDVVRAYPDEPLHYYQPLWEPVSPWGYKGTDAGLVRIMQIAYEAVHAVDPKAVVVGPGGSSMDKAQIQWNERLLRTGLNKYVDAISTHPYVPHPAEKNNFIENLRAFDAAIQRATGKKQLILGTEQGFTTHEDIENELGQAQGMVRQNLMTLGEGFACNFAFYTADFRSGRETGYGMYYNLSPDNVSWNADFVSPKPVVPAYAAMTMLLDGKRSNGPIQGLNGTALGYAFQRGNQIVGALWDYERKDAAVKLPIGAAKVVVYDWMGRSLVPQVENGLLRLNLGPEPVYVQGLPIELYGTPSERRIMLKVSETTILPEESKVVSGQLRLGPGEKSSDFAVDIESNTIPALTDTVKVDSQGAITIPVKVPAQTVVGRYELRMVARRAGVIVGIVESKIVVRPVIQISKPIPEFANGKPALKVKVENNSDRAQTLKLAASIPSEPTARAESNITLPPGGSDFVSLTLPILEPMPSKRYGVEVVASSRDWAPSRQMAEVNFMAANAARQPFKIDGDLSDWPNVHSVTIAGREKVIRSAAYYTGGVESVFQFAWDSKALYIACEVKSPSQIQPFSGSKIWRGDSLQLAINMTPGESKPKTGNMAADAGAQEYTELTLALTEGGPQAERSVTFDPSRLPTSTIDGAEIPLAIVRQGDKTTYEAAIPWTSLGRQTKVVTRQNIGIAATVNKIFFNDQPDPCALGLFGGIAASKDPEKFGTLILRQ